MAYLKSFRFSQVQKLSEELVDKKQKLEDSRELARTNENGLFLPLRCHAIRCMVKRSLAQIQGDPG